MIYLFFLSDKRQAPGKLWYMLAVWNDGSDRPVFEAALERKNAWQVLAFNPGAGGKRRNESSSGVLKREIQSPS